MNDPDGYPFSCAGCSSMEPPVWGPKNTIFITLTLFNNFLYEVDNTRYEGYDLRAILVQNDVGPENKEALEMVDTYVDGYTDIFPSAWYTPGDPDPSDPEVYGHTNPFIAYWHPDPQPPSPWVESDRVFPSLYEQTRTFELAVNTAEYSYQIIHALIMIDVCQMPPVPNPPLWPNCREPYRIDIDRFPQLPAGTENHALYFYVTDHQCEQSADPSGYSYMTGEIKFYDSPGFWGEISYTGDQPEHPANQFAWLVYISSVQPAGLYEGVLTITDPSAPPGYQTIKQKIWLTVERNPETTGSADLGSVGYLSSPIRADIDVDGDLEVIFTADHLLYALGTTWGWQGADVTGTGFGAFIGEPTICTTYTDGYDAILLAWDPGDQPGYHPTVMAINPTNGGTLWSAQLPSTPAAHPVSVNTTDTWDDNEIFVLCEGGSGGQPKSTLALYNKNNQYNQGKIWEAQQSTTHCYFGAPAVLSLGGSNSRIFTIKQDQGTGQWTLEGWGPLGDSPPLEPSSTQQLLCTTYNPLYKHSPAILWNGDYYVIVSTPAYVSAFKYTLQNQLLETDFNNIPLPHMNWGAQIAIGDMNRDNWPDIVVPYMNGISAYNGIFEGVNAGSCIWSYAEYGVYMHFNSPSLLDFNGDSYLDVVSGVYCFQDTEIGYRLAILDGSPYNNHLQRVQGLRIIWDWMPPDNQNPDYGYEVMGQAPVLSKTPEGNLRIGMTFKKNDYYTSGDAIYRGIDTKALFHDEGYQRKQWVKTRFNLANWNNFNEDIPPWEE